jgi:TIR domain
MRRRAPPRVFLSYRREDTSGHAGRLYDVLVERYGESNVFMDVDTIDVGDDFAEAITRAVASCDALIALIGRRWLNAVNADGRRRLDDPNDFVRLELEAALERDIPVVPARVQGARQPPAAELPATVAPLALRQGVELDDEGWHDDVDRLIERLGRAFGSGTPGVREQPPWRRTAPRALAAIVALVVAGAGFAFALDRLRDSDASAESAVAREEPELPAVLERRFSVVLPAGNRATIDERVYEIVGSRVEQRNPGEQGLHLTVRLTNKARFDTNFWARSFRLVVDGVARAPTSDLNEIVAAGTTGEGVVAFAVPEAARRLVLLVEDQVRVPLVLRSSG